MTTGPTADVVWVDILPSLDRFAPSMRAGLARANGTAAQAGRAAGAAYGSGFGASAADSIASAQARVQAASKRLADAQGAAEVAQKRLNDAQASGTATSGRLAAAEEAVAKAQRNVELQTANVGRAESALSRVRVEATAATGVAADKQALLTRRTNESRTATKLFSGALGEAHGALRLLATAGLGLPGLAIGGVFYEAVKSASAFQAQMKLVQTQAGATAAEVAKLTPAILGLAGKTAQAPEELALSLYHAESTGLHFSKAMDVVTASAKFATVAHANLEETTNALTATIASGIPGVKNLDQAVGALNATVGTGDMKLSDLNEALGSGVLAVVKQYGINIRDVGAALATFGDNNVRGAQAATYLRMAVQAMAVPMAKGVKDLQAIGISQHQLAVDMQRGGLNKAITDLEDHLTKAGIKGNQVGAILTAAFGKRAGPGLAVLIGQFSRLQSKYADINKATDDFNKEWQATTQTAYYQFKSLGDSIKVLGIRLGDALLPVLGNVAHWLTATGLPTVQNFASKIGGLFHSPTVGAFEGTVVGLFNRLKAAAGVVVPVIKSLAQDIAHLATSFVQSGGLHDLATEIGAAFNGLVAAFRGVSSVALPALGGLVKGFGALPGPVQAVTVAFIALRGVMAAGWLDGFALRGLYALDVVKKMGSGIVSALGGMTQAFKVAALEAASFSASQGASGGLASARGAIAGLGAAAGTAAKGGLAAMRVGAKGLVSLFGGPWMVALAAAGVGIGFLVSAIQRHDAAIRQATLDVQKWNETIALGNFGPSAAKASQNLADLKSQIADVQAQLARGPQGAEALHSSAWIETLRNKLSDLRKELDQGNAAWKRQYAAMTPVQEAQIRVKIALSDLNDQIHKYGPNSLQARTAAALYADAQGNLATQTGRANDAQKTQIQRLQDQGAAALTSIQNGIAAAQAQQGLNDSIAQFTKDASSGQVSASQLSEEQSAIAQSAMSAATAAGTYAASQAKAKGVTDTTNASNQAQLQVLRDVAKQMGTNTPAAIVQAIKVLSGATVATGDVTDAVKKMGLTTVTESGTFQKEFQGNATVLKDVTAGQIKDLQNLGLVVTQLPNHQILVSANTQAARDAITQLTKDYHSYAINLGIGGIGAHYVAATGGVLPGFTPGKDVHTFTSPTAGTLSLSGGEAIMRPEFTAAVGSGWINSVNSAAMSGGISGVKAALGGFASGGILPDWSLIAKVGLAPGVEASALSAMEAQLRNAFLAPSGGAIGSAAVMQALAAAASAYGWSTGAQWNDLLSVIRRESGFNPAAHNPTSSAAGLGQFITSTWDAFRVPAAFGYPTMASAPVMYQAEAIMRYIQSAYGTPAGAWNSEVTRGWYHDGGVVPGPAGANVPAMLLANERVLTPPQDDYFRRFVTATEKSTNAPAEFTGTLVLDSGEFLGVVRGQATRVTNGVLQDWYRGRIHR